MTDKASLRQHLLQARLALTAEQRTAADAAIARQLVALLDAEPARVLGIYQPMRGEVGLTPLLDALAGRAIRFALPTVRPDQALRFVTWAPGDALVRDALGVMVPAGGEVVVPDTLLIPCVGFNAACQRLGYGGGYYDRTLAATPRPRAIGIAHTLAAAFFTGEAHDIALDCIVTESGVLRPAIRNSIE